MAQKITTFLWFDKDTAEEAAKHYVGIFGGKILDTARTPDGKALTVRFELEGQEFIALDGGPLFKFTEAISLLVNCETQEEVDALWDKLLSGGGAPGRCGWLKDKYGLSWQIVPATLGKLLTGKSAGRVMEAMLKMDKLDIARLKAAASA